jgi:hypothetical protein
LGWINTFYPAAAAACRWQAFFIFMIMQFIRGIPKDLDEAAEMDGCGKGSIFFRIILPQIVPAMITAAIFAFYWTWEDFLTPLDLSQRADAVHGLAGAARLCRPIRHDRLGRYLCDVEPVAGAGLCDLCALPTFPRGRDQHHRAEGITPRAVDAAA